MKIPRKIEWRAGALLFSAAIVLLSLFILLMLVRTDVGMEVKGIIKPSEAGWMLTIEIPEAQLALLRQCKYIRLPEHERESYAQIIEVSGCLEKPAGIRAKIKIKNLKIKATPDTTHTLRVMLIKRKKVPVLKMLLDSVFSRQRV